MISQQQQEQEQGRRASGSSIALLLSFKCRPQLSFSQQKFDTKLHPQHERCCPHQQNQRIQVRQAVMAV